METQVATIPPLALEKQTTEPFLPPHSSSLGHSFIFLFPAPSTDLPSLSRTQATQKPSAPVRDRPPLLSSLDWTQQQPLLYSSCSCSSQPPHTNLPYTPTSTNPRSPSLGSPPTQTRVADLVRDPAAISADNAQQPDLLQGMNFRATNRDELLA
jgi:hypothetical protein